MIVRDIAGAEGSTHDIIVVGGGIYGATVALEAVSRGLRPLLIDRSDFGSETTAKSLRIIHGGLRYVGSADLSRFRDSVIQRRWWLRMFPDLVRPMPCVMPLYGGGLERPSIMRAGLALNDLLSINRNRGVVTERRLPPSRVLTATETVSNFPAVRKEGLRGGAFWYDGTLLSPARALMRMLGWTADAGGMALNYVEATDVVSSSGRVEGIVARDRISGAKLEFRAPIVVNAAGPWVGNWLGPHSPGRMSIHLALAFNLVLTRALPASTPVAVRPPGKNEQILVLRPSGALTIAGTGHAPWESTEPPVNALAPLVRQFLSSLRRAIPEFDVSEGDVVSHLCGLQPADAPGSPRVATRPIIFDHGARGGVRGLVSVAGVKLTTAPGVAIRVMDRLSPRTNSAVRSAFYRGLPAPDEWYSRRELIGLADRSRREAAELLRSMVVNESALCLEDLMLHRLDWGFDAVDHPSDIEFLDDLLKVIGTSLPRNPSALLAEGSTTGGVGIARGGPQ